VAMMPFYYRLVKTSPRDNSTYFHHWVIPIALATIFFTIEEDMVWWLFPAFMSLMVCFYLWSTTLVEFKQLSLFANGNRILSAIGIVIMLLVWSFQEPWKDVFGDRSEIGQGVWSQGFWIGIVLLAISVYLLQLKRKSETIYLLDWGAVFFAIIFFVGIFNPFLATILINVLVLSIAVSLIYKGIEDDHLGVVNFGLITLAILIICRFFDIDISFFIRGLLFIGVGVLFFLVNYRIIQKRKAT